MSFVYSCEDKETFILGLFTVYIVHAYNIVLLSETKFLSMRLTSLYYVWLLVNTCMCMCKSNTCMPQFVILYPIQLILTKILLTHAHPYTTVYDSHKFLTRELIMWAHLIAIKYTIIVLLVKSHGDLFIYSHSNTCMYAHILHTYCIHMHLHT